MDLQKSQKKQGPPLANSLQFRIQSDKNPICCQEARIPTPPAQIWRAGAEKKEGGESRI